MLVTCRDYKVCDSRKNCPHAKLHEHNSISYQKCVNVKHSACFCSNILSEKRKEKLKKNYEFK